jgi:hypothetical protein
MGVVPRRRGPRGLGHEVMSHRGETHRAAHTGSRTDSCRRHKRMRRNDLKSTITIYTPSSNRPGKLQPTNTLASTRRYITRRNDICPDRGGWRPLVLIFFARRIRRQPCHLNTVLQNDCWRFGLLRAADTRREPTLCPRHGDARPRQFVQSPKRARRNPMTGDTPEIKAERTACAVGRNWANRTFEAVKGVTDYFVYTSTASSDCRYWHNWCKLGDPLSCSRL